MLPSRTPVPDADEELAVMSQKTVRLVAILIVVVLALALAVSVLGSSIQG